MFQVGRTERTQILRELISDAESETPRTVEEGVEKQGAISFLRRKFDEANREVITGD